MKVEGRQPATTNSACAGNERLQTVQVVGWDSANSSTLLSHSCRGGRFSSYIPIRVRFVVMEVTAAAVNTFYNDNTA